MHNKDNKSAILTAVIAETILIISVIISYMQNNLKSPGLYILAVVCITIPFIISFVAKKIKIFLPKSFNIVSIVFIFAAQYFGEINRFYITFWWWDLLLHAAFGSYAVIIFLHIIKGIIRRGIEVSNNRFVMLSVIFAFSFAVSLGTIWEIFEFTGDIIFKTGMIKGGLEDTSTDLLVKIAAAFITSTYYYLKNREI